MSYKERNLKWVILVICCLVIMVNAGIRFSFGVFFNSLQSALSVSRSSLSLAQSFFELGFGFFQLTMGRIVDLRGSKQVMAAGLAILAVSFLLLTRIKTIWLLYLVYGLLIPFGAGSTSLVTGISLVKRWFPSGSTFAVSMATASVSVGQLVLIPVISYFLINQGVSSGYLFLSLLAFVTLVPVLAVLPNRNGSGRDGTHWNRLITPLKFGQVARSRPFWTLSTVFMVCGFGFSLIATHIIPYAADLHIDLGHAANALALTGGISIIGTLGGGYLSGYFSRKRLTFLLFMLRALAMVLLLGPVSKTTLYIFAIIIGLTWTTTVPLITDLSTEKFGVESAGTVLGALFFLHQVGAAAGSYMGGLIADYTHGYHTIFIISIILDVAAALLILTFRGIKRFNAGRSRAAHNLSER